MNHVINGVLSEATELRLSWDDRGFRYGDGLFETFLLTPEGIRLWPYHLQRLSQGMQALHMHPPAHFTPSQLAQEVRLLAQSLGLESARGRLHVWREPGGIYTPKGNGIEYLITLQHTSPAAGPLHKVALAETSHVYPSPWSAYKTHNALPYIMAGLERERRGLDDMILTDTRGHLAEATYSNLFWRQGGTYYTPALSCGCLAGVMRRHVMQTFTERGIEVREGEYTPQALQAAEQIFTSNSMGLRPLTQWQGRALDTQLPSLDFAASLMG